MRRELDGGYELDDDRDRIDLDAVHAYLTNAYWAEGRSREKQQELNDVSARVVGLYHEGRQVGFARAELMPGRELAYLYDVYVLDEHRGRGLGEALVRATVDEGPYARYRWLLDTRDAHGLYEKFGFAAPSERLMERRGRTG